jgi:hypothetical protein
VDFNQLVACSVGDRLLGSTDHSHASMHCRADIRAKSRSRSLIIDPQAERLKVQSLFSPSPLHLPASSASLHLLALTSF